METCNLHITQLTELYVGCELYGNWNLAEMHVLFFSLYLENRIRLYTTNPTMPLSPPSHSDYTSWDWNLAEMHLLFFDIG